MAGSHARGKHHPRLLPAGDQAAEGRAVLEAVAARQFGRALLDAVADALAGGDVQPRNLALVAHEGGDLLVDRARDVDDDVGRIWAPVPQLAHLVRRAPL